MTKVFKNDLPKRRGLIEFLAILIAGGAGVVVALFSDFVQKGDTSALLILNTFMNGSLDLDIPILHQATALLIAGAIAVLVFDPRTKRAAFMIGASILAIFTTVIPVQDYENLIPILEEVLPLLELENGVIRNEDTSDSEDTGAATSPDDSASLMPQNSRTQLALTSPRQDSNRHCQPVNENTNCYGQTNVRLPLDSVAKLFLDCDLRT